MKTCIGVALYVMLVAGCAHLEVDREDIYPFRAEFTARGTVRGSELNLSGAILLTSTESGTIQTYGPGGMATGAIDITAEGLVIRDMWGRETGTVDLPLSGIVGLVAGDIPRGAYVYKEKTVNGVKVVYPWGSLYIDEAVLPREIHVSGDRPLEVGFAPLDRKVELTVTYGEDVLWITLLVSQGGRWISS